MKKIRKCAFCGKEFVANSGSQKYCSKECAEAAKAARKKRQQDFSMLWSLLTQQEIISDIPQVFGNLLLFLH